MPEEQCVEKTCDSSLKPVLTRYNITLRGLQRLEGTVAQLCDYCWDASKHLVFYSKINGNDLLVIDIYEDGVLAERNVYKPPVSGSPGMKPFKWVSRTTERFRVSDRL